MIINALHVCEEGGRKRVRERGGGGGEREKGASERGGIKREWRKQRSN